MDLDELFERSTRSDVPIDVDAAWQALCERTSDRRMRRLVAAGLSIALVAGSLGVVTVLSRDQRTAVTSDEGHGAPSAPDTWRPIAPSLLSARVPGVAVWTGDEMLVVGGSSTTPCGSSSDCLVDLEPLGDGGAYSPSTDSWRSIAAAPLPFAQGIATWTGTEMLVLAEVKGVPQGALLSYDPVADSWERRADPPDPGPFRSVWTGQSWIFIQQARTAGERDWMYLPLTNTWQELSADPIGIASDRQIVWTGESVIVFASVFDAPGQPTNGLYRAAALDEDLETWHWLPDPEIVNNGNRWVSAGNFVVNPTGGSTRRLDGEGVVDHGGMFNLQTQAWGPLPARPALEELSPQSRTGYIGAAGAWVVDDSVLFDPSSREWHEVTPRPDKVKPGASVWTGAEILTWGGYLEDEDSTVAPELSALGFAYRPPNQ